MSDDNAIIQDLIGALSSNTVELNNLTRQVAAQGDTLNEVKRHSESVKKSVDWANLGDDVYEGVAAATTAKIDETLDASAKIVAQADALSTASIDQRSAVDDLRNALKTTSEEKREATRATERLHSAAEALGGTYRGGFVRMLLVGALTASLGLFGGYWWAKETFGRKASQISASSWDRQTGKATAPIWAAPSSKLTTTAYTAQRGLNGQQKPQQSKSILGDNRTSFVRSPNVNTKL